MASFSKSDLEFILAQIKIAEAHAAGQSLVDLLPNPEFAFGLRTIDGTFNNLVPGQSQFGAADTIFPRLTTPVFRTAEAPPPGFRPPAAPATSYAQTSGLVFDSQPRTISNLIVDDTASNPAAVAATFDPGPDGILGTADDIHEQANTTTPFVDQNQTYSSHPSHQVFLRAYEFNAAGDPVATGKLITNRDLGADGKFGTADDVEIVGMATWKVVKAQARDILGINLTAADFDDVPLLATDPYGNFIKGPNGFPQVITGLGPDGIPNTA